MTGPYFVDTNVLIYRRDADDPAKQQRAREWLDFIFSSGSGRLSYQVLIEYCSAMTRKARVRLDPGIARRDVRGLLAWDPVPHSPALLERAWAVEDRYGLSWWDSLIVAAAQIAGCDALLTEDLQAGQDFDGVRVIDPFATSPAEAGL